MDNVQPIRDDVEPIADNGRAMLEHVAERMIAYKAQHGCDPFAIAFVLVGADKVDSVTDAYSWAPGDEQSTRLHTCSVASAVLLKRALGIE